MTATHPSCINTHFSTFKVNICRIFCSRRTHWNILCHFMIIPYPIFLFLTSGDSFSCSFMIWKQPAKPLLIPPFCQLVTQTDSTTHTSFGDHLGHHYRPNKQTPQSNGLDMQWKLVQAGRGGVCIWADREEGLRNAVTIVEEKQNPLKVSEHGQIRNGDIAILTEKHEVMQINMVHTV